MILPESSGLLSEIADVLIKNPRIKRVEVQGHTDNTGTPEHNMKLSLAVRRYHYRHHFQQSSRGFGVTSPLWDRVFRTSPLRRRRAA